MVIFVLNQCAKNLAENFSKSFAAITKQFYMNDYVHLLPTITESKYTVKQVKEFWIEQILSNCPEVLEQILCEVSERVKRPLAYEDINGIL